MALLCMQGAINIHLDHLCGGLPVPALGLFESPSRIIAVRIIKEILLQCVVWLEEGARHIHAWQIADS